MKTYTLLRIISIVIFQSVFCLFANSEANIVGRIITYADWSMDNKELYYQIGDDEEKSITLDQTGKFSIRIEEDKLPTMIDIIGFHDQRKVVGGTAIINKKHFDTIDFGDVFVYEEIYLKKIPDKLKANDITIKWQHNLPLVKELIVEIGEPTNEWGKWKVLFSKSVGNANTGEIKMDELGFILSDYFDNNVFISIYAINDTGETIATSVMWQVKILN
jgi:hypothetical protein